MKPQAKILIIDDVPENLLLLCDLLEEKAYKVHLASDGRFVLNNIENAPPDLILLDIQLSGMNGYDLCYQLKANPNTQPIPIIFLSALEDPKIKVKAFNIGGADYITKPFQEEEVIARIENQLTIQRQKQELENLQTQLFDQNQILEQQNRHLQLLVRLTKMMNAAETIDGAIAQVLHEICHLLNWDYGEAWILDTDGAQLERSNRWYASHPKYNWGYHDERLLAMQTELVNQIAQSQTIEWIAPINNLDDWTFSNNNQLLQDKIQQMGLTSLLGVPIIFKETVLAVLILLGDCSEDQQEGASVLTDSPNWLNLIQSVASQLGTLLQRLRTETALKQANCQLQQLVAYDGLTQIANRRRFDEYFEEQWRQGKRVRSQLSLILCDLDAFKAFNDYFGHQAGDNCLQQVASAISKVVNRPLDLVARYGGEELAVLLPCTPPIGAFQVAEKIREAVKQLQINHPQSPVSHWVTVSIGVSSIVPWHDCSPKTLIRMADKALYQAKEMGRDRVILNNQLAEEALSPLELS